MTMNRGGMEISVQGPVVPGDTETFALENIEIDMVDGAPFGDFHQPPHILEGLINPEITSHLDYITVVSPDKAGNFAQYMAREDIRVILHGIVTSHFRPAGSKAR